MTASNEHGPAQVGRGLRTRLWWLAGLTVVAFHTSLASLVIGLGGQTPLAYAGLVPIFAALIAAGRRTSAPWAPAPSRSGDGWLGIAAIAVALCLVGAPSFGATGAWAARLDLVAFPLFVIGATVMVFGSPVARSQRFALAFLLLAWPLPYMVLLFRLLPSFSNMTVEVVRLLLHVVPVARPASGGDGTTFVVGPHGFPIGVAATCSGISSVFGFLLLGVTATVILDGSRWRKAAWIVAGLCLAWVLNLARILAIFGIAGAWNSHVALDDVHPYAGLFTFSVATGVIALSAPRFGLRWRDLFGSEGTQPRPMTRPSGRPPGSAVWLKGCALLIAAVSIGFLDGRLPSLDPARRAVPESGVAAAAPSISGWTVTRRPDVRWAAPYFGEEAEWARYAARRQSRAGAVEIDLIDSTDRYALAAYGISAYFGGFQVATAHRVRLSDDVEAVRLHPFSGADVLAWTQGFRRGAGRTYQEVFVRGSGGEATRYDDALAAARALAGGDA